MHVLIIEDEGRIARRLERMTHDFFADQLKVCTLRDELEEGLAYLKENEIDLLLLDLNLNGKDSFELLKKLTAYSFHVIIVSAYHDKALEAFEYGVLDFVPKPFNAKRLFQAFNRLGKISTSVDSPLKYLAVHKKGVLRIISVSEIAYIQGAGVYTEIVLNSGEQLLHTKSLDQLSQLLPDHFFRIHKSYLIDLQQLQSIRVEGGGKYTAILQNGQELPVGRTKYKLLKKLFPT